jgi:methylmalonyl-CoA mutase C-terminal domain/subunit
MLNTSLPNERRGRVLLAKPGLDGHNRGALVMVRALRDAGFEVIYLGRRQTSAQIVSAAIQEDVDLIGLSILSGSHVELCERLVEALRVAGVSDIPVILGGTIRPEDQPVLDSIGIAAFFPTGTSLQACIDGVTDVVNRRRKTA